MMPLLLVKMLHLNYDDSSVVIEGGFAGRQVKFADNNSTLTMLEGSNALLKHDDYQVDLSQDFQVFAYQDDKGKVTNAQVTTGQFSADNLNDGDHLSVLNSTTSFDIQKTLKIKKKLSIFLISPKALNIEMGRGIFSLMLEMSKDEAVKTDDVLYGLEQ